MNKPLLCIDFDGVIHSYEKGWQGGVIYGTITPGFIGWAEEASKLFRLVIYSSRSKETSMLFDMQRWMEKQQVAYGSNIKFEYAAEKPPAFLTIDDRAVRFEGNWNAPELDPKTLLAFKPWMLR
jgi:hypothetical protein